MMQRTASSSVESSRFSQKVSNQNQKVSKLITSADGSSISPVEKINEGFANEFNFREEQSSQNEANTDDGN